MAINHQVPLISLLRVHLDCSPDALAGACVCHFYPAHKSFMSVGRFSLLLCQLSVTAQTTLGTTQTLVEFLPPQVTNSEVQGTLPPRCHLLNFT